MGVGAIPQAIVTQVANLLSGDASTFAESGEVYCGLFKNNIVPTPLTVWGDIEEADFDGYARVNLDETAAVRFLSPDGGAGVMYPEVASFTAGGGLAEPQTIYGYFAFHGTSPQLLFVNTFDEPIEMAVIGQTLPLIPATGILPAIGRFPPIDT